MRRLASWESVLTVLLVVSVTINLVLACRLSAVEQMAKRTFEETQLAVGSNARTLELFDLEGRTTVIDALASDRPTVLYVFDPSCGWCSRNSASVAQLHQLVGTRFRFIGLSLSAVRLKEFLSKHSGPPEVYVASAATVRSYRLGGTPSMIVISSHGQIEKVWKGAFVRDLHDEVCRYFGVAIPEADMTN